MCTVSVIMPVYNSKKYLRESIESVMRQTYQDWELLAVNEYGSADGSAEIIGEYEKKDRRIHLIQNSRRLGLAESLNRGFQTAEGKYLARLDADDLAWPERFEKQVQYLETHPNVGILGTYQHHFGKHTDWIHKPPLTPAQCRAGLLFGCDLCHSTLMLRRKTVIENHLYYDNSYLAEDYELWTRALYVTDIANLPEVLGEYRIGEENITNAKKEQLNTESGYIVAANLKRSLGYDLPEDQVWFFRGWDNPFWKYRGKDREEYYQEFEHVLREIIKANRKVGFYEEKELLRVIDAKWRWAKYGTVWNEKREVASIDEIFSQRGKGTGLKYFMKKVLRRPYYAIKCRTVDVILKQLWYMEGKTGRDIAALHSKMDEMEEKIYAAVAESRKGMEQTISNLTETKLQEVQREIIQKTDERVWKAEKNMHQAVDGRVWKAEENIRQAMDGRIWKAEESIHQAMDGRIWKAERNLLDEMDINFHSILKIMPRSMLQRLTVHLAEHCNLNCQCCDNFSPLANESYTDAEDLQRDFARLKELSGGNIGCIELSGGEALLHPQISDFLLITRTCFEHTEIEIVTNGILLMSMHEDFWESCRRYRISIVITKYPIHLNINEIQQKAEKYGVYWRYYDDADERQTIYMPLDLCGKQDERKNFLHCYHANECIYLRGGRIYTCSIAANIHHFNRFFGENLPDLQENSIDIYQAESMQEILEFISKPIPLCNYCHIEGRRFGIPWGVSKREKREWAESSHSGDEYEKGEESNQE